MKVAICGYGGITKINRDSNLKPLPNTETVRCLSEAYDYALKISDIVEFAFGHNLVCDEEQTDDVP